MGLYKQWEEMVQAQNDQAQHDSFFGQYLEKEKQVYQHILKNNLSRLEGRLGDLAAEFSMEPAVFVGFLDGINTSLKEELKLDELNEDSHLASEIDYEKLYWNMHEAKADWLYNLEEWNGILSAEKRDEITKKFRLSKMAVSNKVGRNEPCPCGSGKKYKKCCGR
jgi:hypothetical protein